MDMTVKGDVYTRGSWATTLSCDYNKLYQYNGNFSLSLADNLIGEKDIQPHSWNKDFFVRWLYNQSDKANPNSHFSANVNLGSSTYTTYNPTSTADYLTSTFQSEVSYSTTIANEFNFSLNGGENQNTQTQVVDITLPELTLTANRWYPFQSSERVGNPKWYENINVNYVMDMKNELTDTAKYLKRKHELNRLSMAYISKYLSQAGIKVLKYFTWTNAITYNERWYLNHVREQIVKSTEQIVTNFDKSAVTNANLNSGSYWGSSTKSIYKLQPDTVKEEL